MYSKETYQLQIHPNTAGGGSGSVLGVLQEAHTQMSNTGSSSSTTSSSHQNYGFDRVEICIEDAIEVNESPQNTSCCTFCRENMCRDTCKWRFKDTLGGLRER